MSYKRLTDKNNSYIGWVNSEYIQQLKELEDLIEKAENGEAKKLKKKMLYGLTKWQ